MLGYTGKFLEVDLSTGNAKNVTIDGAWLKDYVGGRGLAAKILSERLIHKWQHVDPLGPDGILLFLPGPFVGYYPGGRICVSRAR